MTGLISLALVANLVIMYACYYNAKKKGYPVGVCTVLGALPYFNLVVWVYLLFLPSMAKHTMHMPRTP